MHPFMYSPMHAFISYYACSCITIIGIHSVTPFHTFQFRLVPFDGIGSTQNSIEVNPNFDSNTSN